MATSEFTRANVRVNGCFLEQNRTPERYVLAKSVFMRAFFLLCEADFYPDFRTDLQAAGFKVAFLSELSNTL